MRRTWVNPLLLLLLAALGALAWLLEPPLPATVDEDRISNLQPAEIGRLAISNGSGPAFEIVRKGSGWRMLTPYKAPANPARVERLLEIASAPVISRFSVPASGLAEFGLAAPRATLQLNGVGIHVGSTDPIHHHRYLGINDQVILIRDIYPHLLLASAESYLSPRLLPAASLIESILTPAWRLSSRQGAGAGWQLEPDGAGVSADLLNKKAADWQNAQAVRIYRQTPAPSEGELEIQLHGRPTPLRYAIIRQGNRRMLLSRSLGVAYDFPDLAELLSAPATSATE